MDESLTTWQARVARLNQLGLTDSPWLWLMVFALAGLMGSFAIGPKYVQREGRLERMQQVRQTVNIWDSQETAARRDAADAGTADKAIPLAADGEQPLNVPLGPLSLLFLVLAAVGAVGLQWSLRKRLRHLQTRDLAKNQTDAAGTQSES